MRYQEAVGASRWPAMHNLVRHIVSLQQKNVLQIARSSIILCFYTVILAAGWPRPMLCSSLQQMSASPTATAPAQMPHVRRASEMAVWRAATGPTGYPCLDAELPGRGWPRSAMVELLLQKAGIGELQLLKPMLSRLSRDQRIALIQPPHVPCEMALRTWGVDTDRLYWIRPKSSGDALWTAEQILKNGSFGGVLLWQKEIRTESLRRLNLAAQAMDTWFWLMRPMASAAEASPAPLRLALRPAHAGISLDIIKRRGPSADNPLFVPLPDMPTNRHYQVEQENAVPPQHLPAVLAARNAAPVLV